MREVVKSLPLHIHPEEEIERNDFYVAKEDDVIGRLAVIKLEKGDTLPDIARHFSLGINTVSSANPGIDTWVPEAGGRLLLPLSFILPDTRRKGIVINLAAMRLFYFKKDGKLLTVSTYPVGIGATEQPTPIGRMYIARKKFRPTWYVPAVIAKDHRKKNDFLPAKVPPGPLNPLGEYALYLSKSGYLVHGTNKPASIGLRATYGCIRLYPEDIKRLYENTPVKTPVRIINQSYLVGQRDGIIYVEAHKPYEESGTAELKKTYVKLRNIEKKSGHALDWKKVGKVIGEARGFPVPIFDIRHGSQKKFADTIKLKRPDKWYGKPEIPELKADAWYVLAATLRDRVDALRLAAIINHQGPPIPARVVSSMDHHRVLAGPFNDSREAKNAAKRLKIDLEIDGILVEPIKEGQPIALFLSEPEMNLH
jgi:L,D-transpeptidase ErfK/SrfK